MERLWKLSLAVLLLGIAIDGWCSYIFQASGSMIEMNPFALWILECFDPFSLFILGSFLKGTFLALLAIAMKIVFSKVYGHWSGVRCATAFGFIYGVASFLGGTGWAGNIVTFFVPDIDARSAWLGLSTLDALLLAASFMILIFMGRKRQASKQ